MKKKVSVHVGGASILVVFSVLFFAVFGSLSLSSAHADLRLSQKAQQSTQEYYTADAAAQQQLAKLLTEVTSSDQPTQLTVQVNDRQQLLVSAIRRGDEVAVLSYQLVRVGTDIYEESPGDLYGGGPLEVG